MDINRKTILLIIEALWHFDEYLKQEFPEEVYENYITEYNIQQVITEFEIELKNMRERSEQKT